MDIDHAVQSAKAFASKSLGAERTTNIRLEEIESSVVDGKPVWQITLSSEHSDTTHKVVLRNFGILGTDSEREYKVFTVTRDAGEVLSMKIRLLATPGA
jgi:hypothetical protein